MTIANQTRSVRETGNGSKTAFTFDFTIYAVTDVLAYKITNSTGVRTLGVYTTDYTVSINAGSEGGTVNWVVAPTALEDSFIESNLPYTQATDIPEVGGVREEQIEKGLDKLCILVLQLLKKVQLSLKFVSSSTQVDVLVPEPESLKSLRWNTLATALENYTADITSTEYPGDISYGADASKAASPSVGDIYMSTDTENFFVCFSAGTWTDIVLSEAGMATIINALSVVTAVSTDHVLIADASDSANLKRALVSDLTATVASQANMETATDNTVMVTPLATNWHPGVAKAWCNFNGSGTPAMNASHNFDASITDNGTGDYTLAVTTDFSSANFAVGGSCQSNSNPYATITVLALTAGTIRIFANRTDSGLAVDGNPISVLAFGDQ